MALHNLHRPTAAEKRAKVAAVAAAHEAADRHVTTLTLEDYLAQAADLTHDLSTGAEFLEFHTARHARLTALYSAK